MRRRSAPALVAAVLAAGLLLTGCTQHVSLPATKYDSDGVTEWKTALPAVTFSGTTVTGTTFDSKTYAGRVLVVNFWYAGCGPCRQESAGLEKLTRQYAAQGVQFVGVDVRDQSATAASFLTEHGISYPSILDEVNRSAVQYQFAKTVPPSVTPTTLVLSKRHGVTARIVGEVTDPSTLAALIVSALKGST